MSKKKLRSQEWYGRTGKDGFIYRSWMKNQGLLNKKINVLIVEGQNNHKNWMETTQIMKDQLVFSGLFSVDVVRTPTLEQKNIGYFNWFLIGWFKLAVSKPFNM